MNLGVTAFGVLGVLSFVLASVSAMQAYTYTPKKQNPYTYTPEIQKQERKLKPECVPHET